MLKVVLVAKASIVLPSPDPLLKIKDKFQTLPLKIGPNELLAFALILPAEASSNEPDTIIRWANDAESTLVWSKLWDIPTTKSWVAAAPPIGEKENKFVAKFLKLNEAKAFIKTNYNIGRK